MIFSKRGQLGKIITSLPVMILIFLVIAIYLVLAGFVFSVKGASVPSEIVGVELDSVLLREVNIEIEKVKKSFLIFDGIVSYWNDEIKIYQLGEGLNDFMQREGKEDYCLAIAQGVNENPAGLPGGEAIDDFFYRYKDEKILAGSTGSKPNTLRRYEKEGLLNQISFTTSKSTNRKIYVQYYYGRCLDE